MKKIDIPILATPAVVGPGTQPENPDGEEMTFMQMPSTVSGVYNMSMIGNMSSATPSKSPTFPVWSAK